MKTKLFILILFTSLSLPVLGQSQNYSGNDSSYAIIQVLLPQTIFGEFKIRIFYGNDKIEEFKNIKYSKNNRKNLSTYVVDALNYMKSKGYKFEQAITFTLVTIETQYIMRKPE